MLSKSSMSQIAPMSLHYRNDGNGRDSYIQNNNGGFTVPNIYPKPGTIGENMPAYVTSRHMPVASRFSPYI